MPALNWIGKEAVVTHHQKVRFSSPTEDVIEHVVSHRKFISIKVVVFVRDNSCHVWTTNLV